MIIFIQESSNILTSAKLNAKGLRWIAVLANFKFRIHYCNRAKNKDADYLLRHTIAETEQMESRHHSINEPNNIRLASTSIIKIHIPSINVDKYVLQLQNSEDITSITSTQLIDSRQQDISITAACQFVQLKIKSICKT